MTEPHDRVVAETASELRAREPAILVSAYSQDGTPTVVLSTDDTVELEGEAINDLLGAIISAVADQRDASKETIASYLADYAKRLEIEAAEEDIRYRADPKAGHEFDLPDGDN